MSIANPESGQTLWIDVQHLSGISSNTSWNCWEADSLPTASVCTSSPSRGSFSLIGNDDAIATCGLRRVHSLVGGFDQSLPCESHLILRDPDAG